MFGDAEFGSIYAVATIGSALTLPWLGGYFDKLETRRYSMMVLAGLFVSLLLLSYSYHVIMVLVAFYGLRLFGQGLMSHTSVSSMARYFSTNRGKAIGAAGVGHPAGEAVMPLLITLLIGAIGWRGALQISALTAALFVAPLALLLLNLSKTRIRAYHMQKSDAGEQQQKVNVTEIIRQKKFWIITPVVFVVGFTNTAIFFFQLKLGEAKGWSPEWVAGSISAFALAGAIAMTGIGAFVDRYTAKKMFPFHMLPYLLGLAALILFEHPLVYPAALTLFGLGHGTGKTIKDAMLTEIYGADIIGQVRSVFIMVMVLSTAIGPVVFGIMLDMNISYTAIFTGVPIATLLTTLNGLRRV
ncbi:MAG: MFS transporter [Bacteroidales bacterium]|nr:MFS transporter [Bacteroidales bacterium]